ncbi:hypothetical protein [uncultured Treponema sp.]|uniref:hypothetical protein n=1 Tax=uncultured Treponema sp. TaxID=162155 RepID=UPI0025886C97|nr:hypothetical protein [uncultured Treponema sp.]
MRKFGFTALVSFLFLLASCMNMGGSSGEDGAIRVALPGSGSRGAYNLSKENAKTYKVALLLDGENLKTQTSEAGGADIVFDELEPATYTVQVEAYDTTDVLLARKSETIKVTAGETAECSIALKLFASSILDSGYILWKYESSAYNFYREDSITEKASDICCCYGEPFGAVEDLKSNWYCVEKSSNDNGTGVLYRYDADSKKEQIAEISDFGYYFTDPLYYDPTEDALWFASYNNDILSLSKNKSPSSISSVNNINAVSGIDFSGKIGLAFAVQGSSLYLVYTDLSNFYFQYGKISGDGPFVFEPIGSPKTVSDLDLGVSGTITDVAILYDGTVYVLVSNVGNSLGDSGDSFIYNYNQSNTMYSRGALLKIQSTSSGFEVVDTLGWTGSSRQIAPVGEAKWDNSTLLQPLTAFIPSLSENSKKFYGPRRFVAIKPKEIAIADCGANFVMPNCNERQNGKMFAHNRVVTVSLSSFAISVVTELKNIKFSNLTLGGTGTSGGYINADDCNDKDKVNGEIVEQ